MNERDFNSGAVVPGSNTLKVRRQHYAINEMRLSKSLASPQSYDLIAVEVVTACEEK